MKKPQIKKKSIVLIIIIIVLIVAGFLFYQDYKGPDMGSRLEYIGRRTYTNECFYFCGELATTSYYYATDMSEKELIKYFGKLSYLGATEPEFDSEGGNRFVEMNFRDNSGTFVSVEYHNGSKKGIEIEGLRSSSKNNFIIVLGDRKDAGLKIFQQALK